MLHIPLLFAILFSIVCPDGSRDYQPLVSVRIAGSNQLNSDAAFVLQQSEGTSAVAAVNGIYRNVKYLTELAQLDPNRPIFQHYYFRSDKVIARAPTDIFSVVTMAPVLTVPNTLEAVSPGIFKAPTTAGVFIRFADGYALLAEDSALLSSATIPPLPDELHDQIASDLALTLHLSVLPDEWRQLAQDVFRRTLTDVVANFRAKDKHGTVQALSRLLEECLNRLMNDGRDVRFDILVSRPDKCARVSLTLWAKDNTVLADALHNLGNLSSEFASMYDENAVVLMFLRCQLADSVKRFLQTFDPSVDQFLEVNDEQRESADTELKDLADIGSIVLRTTLEVGHIDVASSCTADRSGELTTWWACFAGGARHLDRSLRDFVRQLAVRGQAGSLGIDVSRYETGNIHRTGDHSYIAIGDSILAVAEGPRALEQLTHLLDSQHTQCDLPPVLVRGKANVFKEPLQMVEARVLKGTVPLSQIFTGEGVFTVRMDAVAQGGRVSIELDQQLLQESAANAISTFVDETRPK